MKKEHGIIVLGAVFYGTVIVGGQYFVELGLSLFQISLFSMLLLLACMLPVVMLKPEYLMPKRYLWFFVIYGLIGAGAELAQFGGLFFGVPVAVIAFLFYTQPLWTIVLGRVMLQEPISIRKVLATVFALAGGLILLGAASSGIKSASTTGLVISVAGGILFSLWVIWGRKSGISDLHFVTTTFGAAAFTTLWLILSWPILSWLIQDPALVGLSPSLPARHWFYLLIFTIVGGLIPNLCFFRGLQGVEAGVAGIILLLEPVIASVLAWVVFSQRPGALTVLGAILILLANYFVNTSRSWATENHRPSNVEVN